VEETREFAALGGGEVMTTFSEYALAELLNQFNNHEDRIGRELYKTNQAKFNSAGLKPTDCITYVIECLQAGFKGTGDEPAASKVGTLGKHGIELARYLVKVKKWTGIHINPDEYHPSDGDKEHRYVSTIVRNKCSYHRVPVRYKVTNYNPTPKDNKNFDVLSPTIKEQKLDAVSYNALKTVKFGFGLSRGDTHTWLFSEGYVYEVHWDRRAGNTLYEKTALNKFKWLSGAIIIPQDQVRKLTTLSGLSCSR